MIVSDAIERAESIYKYSGSSEQLILWLSELEERIALEVLRKEPKGVLSIISELDVPNAYAELYPFYLVMKGAFAEGKTDRYNNYARCFERAYSEYIDYVNRTRQPEKTVYYKIL